MPKITLQNLEAVRSYNPRRCCFAQNPWKRGKDGKCTVSLKFSYLGKLFEAETGVALIGGPYGPWAPLSDKAQIEAALKWQTSRANFVFLRDNLMSSVALGFNLEAPAVYTEIGQAERDAKHRKDKASISFLVSACVGAIKSLALYRDCDMICAVPPSPDKEWDLPTELAARIAAQTKLIDISNSVSFSKKKASVKVLSLTDKWKALESAGLKIAADVTGGKLVLLDDKYQSGTTAQFVASKLYDAGVAEIHGLFCVKTWRDTDNQ